MSIPSALDPRSTRFAYTVVLFYRITRPLSVVVDYDTAGGAGNRAICPLRERRTSFGRAVRRLDAI